MDESGPQYEPPRDVEFRDGIFPIPCYLADVMLALPTHTMTKQEAVAEANALMERRHIEAAYDGVLRNHFGGTR